MPALLYVSLMPLQVFEVDAANEKIERKQVITDPSTWSWNRNGFGVAVALDDTLMVVGAYTDFGTTTSFRSAGAAYIFSRTSVTGTNFTQRARMTHPAPMTWDYCGRGVAGKLTPINQSAIWLHL